MVQDTKKYGYVLKGGSAYNLAGDYIGTESTAKVICEKKGIRPELVNPQAKGCTVGFCSADQKWYGWTHRAMYGFKVGDVVEKGDVTCEYLPIGFEAKSLEDARTMAVSFAMSIS